ncbi:hypothetical protein ACFVXC_32385 [Streptomyces sp. NPDC058257]|uniref:hypothetical protein n=1 Tax=Streptomyces sp. NPDC058257 TaxID=3346409 RepID=UPI0036E7ACA0
MDIRAVVTGFKNVTPLPGLPDAWRWSPVRTLNFAGALSADGRRLLQLSGREWFDEELAIATLEFAREREPEIFARNPHLIPTSARRRASPRRVGHLGASHAPSTWSSE